MKYTLILLFIIFTSCQKEKNGECDYIANYYQKIYKADFEYQTKNYEKAFEYYQAAFKNCIPINTPIYYEIRKFAKTCAILNKNKTAIEFIKKDIDNGYKIEYHINDSIFSKIFSSKQGQKLIKDYDSLRSKYLSKIDLDFRKEMITMHTLDQKYRVNYDQIKMDSIDSINETKLINIFEKKGYPNSNLIGNYSIDNQRIDMSIILRHTNDSIRKKYFIPKLLEFVKNGTCPPMDLAVVEDWYYLKRGEKQIYGMFPIKKDNTIKDLKQVDKNRISIGLPTLEHKRKKDSIFSANQKR